MLRWAGERDPLRAVQLGADVAFCLRGGRARVQGIGELLRPLPFEERTLTLCTPPLHCSTPVVYREWDRLGGPSGDYGNDLEPAALSAYPEMATHRDRFGDTHRQRTLRERSRDISLEDRPLGAVDGDEIAITERRGGRAGADDARHPQLAGDDGGVAGHPAAIGDHRPRAADGRHPIRVGHRSHEDLPGLETATVLR